MPIHIRPAAGISTRQVIGEWTRLIDRGLQEHFGGRMWMARTEGAHEFVILLKEGDATRGEISVSVSPSAPDQLNIRPQPAHGQPRDTGTAMAAGAIVSILGWIVFLVWFWDIFWDIRGLRGKIFWLLMITSGGVISTFGLAFAGDALATRWFERIDTPRRQRSQQFVDNEIWPWMQSYIDQLWSRAQQDPVFARSLGLDFSQ